MGSNELEIQVFTLFCVLNLSFKDKVTILSVIG